MHAFLMATMVAVMTATGMSAPDQTTVEQTIREMEQAQLAAYLKADTAKLDELWADEFTLTVPNGAVLPKAGYLAMVKTGGVKYDMLQLDGLQVRVFGDTAIASARVTVKGSVGDHPLNGTDVFQTVYVKRDGRWRMVSSLATRVATNVVK
jgi:ketosteroid isomerase-like protein